VSERSPRPLSSALAQLSDALAPATTLGRVQAAWEQAAGAVVAAAARPTAELDGVLTVTCEASVWAQELELMSEVLLARLNELLGEGELRELRCRTA